MSEPIATERYRLALIAHYAEMLAELIEEQNKYYKEDQKAVGVISDIYRLKSLSKQINELLNKEESK